MGWTGLSSSPATPPCPPKKTLLPPTLVSALWGLVDGRSSILHRDQVISCYSSVFIKWGTREKLLLIEGQWLEVLLTFVQDGMAFAPGVVNQDSVCQGNQKQTRKPLFSVGWSQNIWGRKRDELYINPFLNLLSSGLYPLGHMSMLIDFSSS
jgi:hypothetical protein